MPASTVCTPSVKSGIETSSSGERLIPKSTRADGSVRKEIKIRPGYKPPEDVEVYKNRTAEAFKKRGTGGIPGADRSQQETSLSAAAGKNAKRREARKKAKGSGVEDAEDEAVTTSTKQDVSSGTIPSTIPAQSENNETEAQEKEKQARNLRKKLRQARELQEKKDSGGNLLPEQFAKVIKIQELIRQLEVLGLDTDSIEESVQD